MNNPSVLPHFQHLEDILGVKGCSDDLNWEVDSTQCRVAPTSVLGERAASEPLGWCNSVSYLSCSSTASLAPPLPWPGVGSSQLTGVLHPSQHKQVPVQKVLRFLVHPSLTTVTAIKQGLKILGILFYILWASVAASYAGQIPVLPSSPWPAIHYCLEAHF